MARVTAYFALLLAAAVLASAASEGDVAAFAKGSDKEAVEKDPVLFKADYAARYATDDVDTLDWQELVTMDYKLEGIKISCAVTPMYDLVVVIHSTNDSIANVTGAKQADLDWLSEAVGVDGIQAAEPVAEMFNSIRGSLKDDCDRAINATNIKHPVNALVTGAGTGATMAPIVAAWVATEYASAHIIMQAFGGDWPSSSAKFNWTFVQFVDQHYFWPATSDLGSIGKGTLDGMTLEEIMAKLESDGLLETDADDTAADMRLLFQHAVNVDIIAPNGTDVTAAMMGDMHVNATAAEQEQLKMATGELPDWSNSTYMEQLRDTAEAYEASTSQCPPGLCKVRLPLLLAGGVYSVDESGKSPIVMAFPDASKQLSGENDADAVVAWDSETRTAYIIAEGTVTIMDALIDMRFIQHDYPMPSEWARIFDDPEVAAGFKEQYSELTYDADDEANIEVQLNALLGDEKPKLIVVAGHSLGGALASLLAPWASLTWPTASILVVTSGSPRAADTDFRDFYYTVVGRQWRFVKEEDLVPAVPPFDYIKHVNFELWLHDNKVIAEERPEFDIMDMDKLEERVADHNSYTYSLIPSEADMITPPTWIQEL